MDYEGEVSIDYSCVDKELKDLIDCAVNARFGGKAGYVWGGPIDKIPDFIGALAEAYGEYRALKAEEKERQGGDER